MDWSRTKSQAGYSTFRKQRRKGSGHPNHENISHDALWNVFCQVQVLQHETSAEVQSLFHRKETKLHESRNTLCQTPLRHQTVELKCFKMWRMRQTENDLGSMTYMAQWVQAAVNMFEQQVVLLHQQTPETGFKLVTPTQHTSCCFMLPSLVGVIATGKRDVGGVFQFIQWGSCVSAMAARNAGIAAKNIASDRERSWTTFNFWENRALRNIYIVT